jgi:hypothetical protein
MARFHVSQDETGFFQLTFENDQGELKLISHQFDRPDQLIEDATEMAASGEFGQATVVVDPSRKALPESAALAAAEYRRPKPRKAGA